MTGVEPDIRSEYGAALDRLARSLQGGGDGHDDVAPYRLVAIREHRSSVNLLVDVPPDGSGRRLFVKRFQDHATTRHQQALDGGDRPRARPVPDPATRLADEAVAMAAIRRLVDEAGRDDWFAVPVVPVAGCPDLLVLERIDALTLAEKIEAGAPVATLDRAARSLGAWLRAFHSLPPDVFPNACPHLARSVDVVRLAGELVDHIGDRRLDRHRDRIVAAMAALPAEVELAPAHGDLNPKNVFVADEGAIAVFDTAAELTMPVHADLANLAVTLEFESYKRPLARTLAGAQRLAEQVRRGYGPGLPPRSELLAFEIVMLIDRWGSLAERRGRSSAGKAVVKRVRREILAAGLQAGVDRRLAELGACRG